MIGNDIAVARDWVAAARSIAVLSGAGISAESGVPTFRGGDGLWRRYRAEDLAVPEAFARNPKLVWEWYDWRRNLIAECKPNLAHTALAEIEKKANAFTLITQNVDGLHDLAGSRNVLKIHGDLWNLRCTRCDRVRTNRAVPLAPLPPCCGDCGGLLRPDVIWFGEMLNPAVLHAAWEAAEQCDLFLAVGTSALVEPAASLPLAAKTAGARLIEINLEETSLSSRTDVSLRGRAAEVLSALVA